jgi:hypothetical protein
MNNKYTNIMDEYRKALTSFRTLTDIDIHDKKFTEKANSIIINEGLYLMFRDGESLADKYLKDDKKNLSLLEENINSLERELIYKYENNPNTKKEKNYSVGSAHDVLEDAKIAFYKGAEYKIKNSGRNLNKQDFFTTMTKDIKYI